MGNAPPPLDAVIAPLVKEATRPRISRIKASATAEHAATARASAAFSPLFCRRLKAAATSVPVRSSGVSCATMLASLLRILAAAAPTSPIRGTGTTVTSTSCTDDDDEDDGSNAHASATSACTLAVCAPSSADGSISRATSSSFLPADSASTCAIPCNSETSPRSSTAFTKPTTTPGWRAATSSTVADRAPTTPASRSSASSNTAAYARSPADDASNPKAGHTHTFLPPATRQASTTDANDEEDDPTTMIIYIKQHAHNDSANDGAPISQEQLIERLNNQQPADFLRFILGGLGHSQAIFFSNSKIDFIRPSGS